MGYGQVDQTDREMMALALGQARASLDAGGVPVGAVLAAGLVGEHREVIAAGHNERVQAGDPVAHGEISCLRNAGRRPSYAGTTLYTTLSPCQMCSGAILLFQIPRVVVGEAETYAGDLGFLAGRGVEVVLLDDPGCQAAMREFQERYPQVWSEDIGGR
jgi:cytosine/creatinine deaminase